MTRMQLYDFANDNDREDVRRYYDKLCDKIKELNKRNDQLSLYLIIIAFVYFFATKSTLSALQLGPVSINDFKIVLMSIPVLFTYFMLEFAYINTHRSVVLKGIKILQIVLYVQPDGPEDLMEGKYSAFTALILPYSRWYELLSVPFQGKNAPVIGCLIIFPIAFLIITPFVFEFYSLRFILQNYWNDIFGKISFCISCYMIALFFYHYLGGAKARKELGETELNDGLQNTNYLKK